jgi:predicted Zn finger-like uncharacterized protein
MDVACDHCQAKIKIPDEKLRKVPKGQSIAINCPKCKKKISVTPGGGAAAHHPRGESKPARTPPPPTDSGGGDDDLSSAATSPFAFLPEGTKTALICEPDDGIKGKIQALLASQEYHVSTPDSPREALKMMRANDFEVLMINEMFGTHDPNANHVLRYLEQMLMVHRRQMFVVLLTKRFKTFDNMTAFNRSVNVIINIADIDSLEKIFNKAFNENAAFFRVFLEIYNKVQKLR